MTEIQSHEVIEFELSKELKAKFRGIFYDTESNSLNLYVKSEDSRSRSRSSPIKCNVDKSSMRNTLDQFNEMVDGTLDPKTKLLCVYSIKFHLREKYVKFNDSEQKWYSKTYPKDPSLVVDKSKVKGHKKESQEQEEQEEEELPFPPIQKLESMNEWRKAVKTKYGNLEKVVKGNLPSLWVAIEFVLSIKSIMNIAGVTLPWFGIILGRASSLKTSAIEMLRDTLNTFYTDIFTPKAFVSNSTAVSKDKLVNIDMLPKVKNKLFLVSELSSMFTKKEEEVQETLGIFTRLADGHGLQTNTGAHGSRGYRDVYFNMIGAAVDIPYKVYKLLGYLGPKLYFIRLPKTAKTEDQYLAEMYADEYPIKFGKVKAALNDYLKVFASCPDMQIEEGTKLSRIPWTKDDDRQASRYIVKSALLLSHLRAVVTTFGDTYGHGGTDYAYATAQIEEPSRAITQLRNLARGHALSKGRTHIWMEDVPIVIKVALSTAPIDRVNVFDLLIAHKGKLTTTLIEESLNMSPPTARKTMTELKAIELADVKPDPNDSSHKLEITLKDAFKWFLTEDFDKLREGFIPEDNSEELKARDNREPSSEPRPLKEKSPPCTIEIEQVKPPMIEECSKCGVKLEAFYLRHSHRCEGTD